MGLALSTYAAPGLALAEFAPACRDRGLDGVELVIDVAVDAEALAARIRSAPVPVVALRASALEPKEAGELAKLSAALRIPLSLPAGAVLDLPAAAAAFEGAGGRLLLGVGTRLDAALQLLREVERLSPRGAVALAWEVRPSAESLADAGAVLFAIHERLGLVRLHGGGPEQREQDGSGVGSLLADLALSGYDGRVILCPSCPEALPKWAEWMASRKIAGCGSQHGEDRLQLDMREVEPRDRLDTILGAYRSLPRGATLRLTVDHDPSCMYYTLEATEAEGSFSFRTLDHGPEVWRAEVTKL